MRRIKRNEERAQLAPPPAKKKKKQETPFNSKVKNQELFSLGHMEDNFINKCLRKGPNLFSRTELKIKVHVTDYKQYIKDKRFSTSYGDIVESGVFLGSDWWCKSCPSLC